LTVTETMNDLELVDIQPAKHQPILSAVTPTVSVKNNGSKNALSFDVKCEMVLADTSFAETVSIDSLASGASMDVSFSSFMPIDSCDIQLYYSLEKNSNDQIAFNDTTSATISISNLIDDFESECSYRIAEDGWATTDKYEGHNKSQYSIHPNGGDNYLSNMDATLTYTLPLYFSKLDTDSVDVILSYWAWAITEDGVDNCYLEVSSDSTTWTAVDTLTGSFRLFENFEVSILPAIQNDADKFWFRFRFVSNESNELFGVFIDDISVLIKKREKDIDVAVNMESQQPLTWQLQQNYPNPFNPSTTIRYVVQEPARISISVYNTVGRQVAVLVDEKQQSGAHSITWHPRDLASGVYMYKIDAKTETGDAFHALKKMLFIK